MAKHSERMFRCARSWVRSPGSQRDIFSGVSWQLQKKKRLTDSITLHYSFRISFGRERGSTTITQFIFFFFFFVPLRTCIRIHFTRPVNPTVFHTATTTVQIIIIDLDHIDTHGLTTYAKHIVAVL